MNPVAYIRRYPFSIMALCNIIGDFCYLGFAFDAQGFVSLPKLAGALFTIAAHLILLAYADDKTSIQIEKNDYAGHALLALRTLSCRMMEKLPQEKIALLRARPVGISFAMLSLNGAGLLIDALFNTSSYARTAQIMMGAFIMIGCGAFSLADYAKGQKAANYLLKIAPTILTLATATNVMLATTTQNIFMIIACVVFTLSNFAGFYTKIDKTMARSI